MRKVGAAALLLATAGSLLAADLAVAPGRRVLMDAHNCYPYDGRWMDRIDRALSAGTPLAIEQDLFWYTDKTTGRSWSIVSHGKTADGSEPLMEHYFFDKIRPIMEQALRDGNQGDWPLITLNLDFKSDEAAHHAEVWKLLGKYENWLCTAERSADPKEATPLRAGPLLVLTGEQDTQERDFYERVPATARVRVFGAVHADGKMPDGATNYRRWWNNPWSVVEKGGQTKAGNWTEAGNLRLKELVNYAHAHGLYIRFYTLDGGSPEQFQQRGWFADYNFGSLDSAKLRWRAAQQAGADFIASDHYEELGKLLR